MSRPGTLLQRSRLSNRFVTLHGIVDDAQIPHFVARWVSGETGCPASITCLASSSDPVKRVARPLRDPLRPWAEHTPRWGPEFSLAHFRSKARPAVLRRPHLARHSDPPDNDRPVQSELPNLEPKPDMLGRKDASHRGIREVTRDLAGRAR